ncbi:MAG: porin [Bacteroidia bacterium]|nr:porin [Bacteroidia bacterium]
MCFSVFVTNTSLFNLLAQQDSSQKLHFEGYLETYYSYDLNASGKNDKPPFLCSYNRNNELNINIGLIQAGYNTTKTRTQLGLMVGTYANVNLAHEPDLLKNIFEAYAGLKLLNLRDIWIDAGIFSSHIGFESAIGKNCWNLTRGITAENTPYYESGAKLSYRTPNQKWLICFLYLNGWQRIQRLSGNFTPAWGHQVMYTGKNDFVVNSSTFVGSLEPDSLRKMRYFHDFYTQFYLTKRLGCIISFDIGVQQKSKNSSNYNLWYSWSIVSKYTFSDHSSIAARVEYYFDDKQVTIFTHTPNGFQTFGYSLNFDYSLYKNTIFRIEARSFYSKDAIFLLRTKPTHTYYFMTTSLAVSF